MSKFDTHGGPPYLCGSCFEQSGIHTTLGSFQTNYIISGRLVFEDKISLSY